MAQWVTRVRMVMVVSWAVLVLSGLVWGQTGYWDQFRGPNGSGVLAGARPPVEIAADGAAWKTAVPTGKSSLVLWGDRMFLTGVEGQRLVTLALDASSGEVLWTRQAPEVSLERMHQANSPAASTPCADAERVYVYFGSYGLLCYDHAGNELWKKPIPTPENMYGVATSPIVHEGRVILVLDDDADLPGSKLSRSKVMALDGKTGEVVWETPRPYNRGVWTTPMIWRHEGGAGLVVLGNGRVYGYDPADGAERWYVRGFAREPIAVPVAGDGLLYVSVSMRGGRGDAELDPEPFWRAMLNFDRDGDGRVGRDEITEHFTWPLRPELPVEHPGFGVPLPGEPEARRRRQNDVFNWHDRDKDGYWTKEEITAEMRGGSGDPLLAAILPRGRGDVTDSHVSWRLRRGVPEIPSPVYEDGRLYLVRAGGVLTCVRADTGEEVYRVRLGASGQYSASPVIAGGHVYLCSEKGVVTVVRCGDAFEVTAQADLGAAIAATPAMDERTLYVRTAESVLAFR